MTSTETAPWAPPAPFTNAYRIGYGALPDGISPPPFEPAGGAIVVQRINRELTTKSGLQLAESTRRVSNEAIVLAVGPHATTLMQYDVNADQENLASETPIGLLDINPGTVIRLYPHCGMDDDVILEDGTETEITYIKPTDIAGIVSRPTV